MTKFDFVCRSSIRLLIFDSIVDLRLFDLRLSILVSIFVDLAYRLSSIVVNRIINPLNTTPTYSMADLDELFSQLLDDLESTVLEVVQRFSSSSTDHESMHGCFFEWRRY